MVSGKFFLLALASLLLYSCYINFVYVNLDQDIYPVCLYDPQSKQPLISEYVTKVDTREALETACSDRYSIGFDLSGESPELYMLSSGSDVTDHYRSIWGETVLAGNTDGQARLIGTNNKEMKNRREITADFCSSNYPQSAFWGWPPCCLRKNRWASSAFTEYCRSVSQCLFCPSCFYFSYRI